MKKSNKIVFAVQSALAVMYSFFACNALVKVSAINYPGKFIFATNSYWFLVLGMFVTGLLAFDVLRRRFWTRGTTYSIFFASFTVIVILVRFGLGRAFGNLSLNTWLFEAIKISLFAFFNYHVRRNIEMPNLSNSKDKRKFYKSLVGDQLTLWLFEMIIGVGYSFFALLVLTRAFSTPIAL